MTFVYALFILLTLIGSVFFDREEGYGKYKLLAYRALCLFLVLIAGLRYGLGGDSFQYMRDFEVNYEGLLPDLWDTIDWQFHKMGYMPLWTAVNVLLRAVTDSFVVFQLIHALIVNSIICTIARRHTQYGFLFLLVYFVLGTFFIFNTEVMRESLAIAIGLLGIEFWVSGKKVWFWLLLVLAVGFHISAVVLAVFPFVKISLSRRNILIFAVLSFIIWLAGDVLLSGIIAFAGSGTVSAMLIKVQQYASLTTNFNGFLRFWLAFLVMPMVLMYFVMQHPMSSGERSYREKMVSLVMLLGVIAAAMYGLSRLTNYVLIFEWMMLAELLGKLFQNKQHFIARQATILIIAALQWWNMFSYWEKNDFYLYQYYLPYTCILDDPDDAIFLLREDAHGESSDMKGEGEGVRDVDY